MSFPDAPVFLLKTCKKTSEALKIQCFLCEKFKKLQEKNDVKIVENEGKKYKISILSVH